MINKSYVLYQVILLISIFSIFLSGCAEPTPPSQGSLLIVSPQPTETIQYNATATYFANPTALTASSVAPTSTKITYKNLPIEGTHCIPDNPTIKIQVIQVIDGDTIEVDIEGNPMYLRYIGIEAPKSILTDGSSAYSAEATMKNAELVGGKEVYLIRDQEPTDGYGYLLGYIITEDVFVNFELVRQGYAKAVPYKPNLSCKSVLAGAEAQAQSESLGIWGQ